MTLGGKIRDARKQCGLSQAQLAEKLGVSRSAIAKWETDKGLPDIGNLKILSRLLNVSVDHLLDDEESEEDPMIRESFSLASYGRGCKKVIKDRVMRDKFSDARIHTLLGRQELPQDMDRKPELLPASPCMGPAYTAAIKDRDKEFYLVEQAGRQFLVTVTDEFLETRLLEQPLSGNSFCFGGWRFIKCNYEIE